MIKLWKEVDSPYEKSEARNYYRRQWMTLQNRIYKGCRGGFGNRLQQRNLTFVKEPTTDLKR